MFERFTDRARRVIVLAQEEARLLNHRYIGTEHVLLGLVAERDGVAAQALESSGISLQGVREQVREIIGLGDTPPAGHIPFTSRAKKALELSLRESLALGHAHIGTEHLLLGLLREGEGVACQIITALGADLGVVRGTVIEVVSRTSPGEAEHRPGGQGRLSPDPPERGWAFLDHASEGALRALLLARAEAAREGRAAIEVRDLAAGVLRAGDAVVIAALEAVGATAPAGVDPGVVEVEAAPLPLAARARAACVRALQYTGDAGRVEPGHLLLVCLFILRERLAEPLGVEAGVLATELTDRLRGAA